MKGICCNEYRNSKWAEVSCIKTSRWIKYMQKRGAELLVVIDTRTNRGQLA